MPDDWKIGSLSEICKYSKDKVNVEDLTLDTYYSTENMQPNRQGAVQATTLPSIKQTTACKKGDVLISNIRPYFKKIIYCFADCGCSTDVLCFVPNRSEYSAFLYCALYFDKFFDYMVAGSKGTKMPRGDKQQIMMYPICIPSVAYIEEFNKEQVGLSRIGEKRKSDNKIGFIESSVTVELYAYTNKADMGVNITKYDYLNVMIEIDLSKELNETAVVSIVSDSNVSYYPVNITDGKGQLNLNDLAYGKYNVTVSVNDDMYYIEDVNDTFSITNVATYITADDLETYYDSDFSYCAYLYDSNGSPLASENVIFSMNGEKFNAITDSNGKALLLGDFKPGNYKVEIYFNGEGKYLKSNITKEIIIKSTVIMPTATKYTFNANYVAYLYDSNGKPLENQTVSLKINSDAMEVKTDANGRLKVVIDMDPGTYSFSITNPKTAEVKTQKITVVKRITENSAVTMYYGAGKYYKVKVFDDNGNIAKGVEVTFKIAGKSYKRTTDSKGYASFKITQKPGKYTITAEYKGFKVSNKVTVKSTIVTKDIKVKKGKTINFPAKLLDKNGKILKNKKVTFKFKGKTYKVKTNKKGIATLKITKKYKKGKYSIQTTYGSLTVKNTIKII